MDVKWTKTGAADFAYWMSNNRQYVERIQELLGDILQHPFSGIGKPEPLKYGLSGKWSRRISKEHRLVYEVKDNAVIIFQCRFHYR